MRGKEEKNLFLHCHEKRRERGDESRGGIKKKEQHLISSERRRKGILFSTLLCKGKKATAASECAKREENTGSYSTGIGSLIRKTRERTGGPRCYPSG